MNVFAFFFSSRRAVGWRGARGLLPPRSRARAALRPARISHLYLSPSPSPSLSFSLSLSSSCPPGIANRRGGYHSLSLSLCRRHTGWRRADLRTPLPVSYLHCRRGSRYLALAGRRQLWLAGNDGRHVMLPSVSRSVQQQQQKASGVRAAIYRRTAVGLTLFYVNLFPRAGFAAGGFHLRSTACVSVMRTAASSASGVAIQPFGAHDSRRRLPTAAAAALHCAHTRGQPPVCCWGVIGAMVLASGGRGRR